MDGRSEAPMKAYRVSGTAPFGSQRQHFSYDLPAADADAATHKVYSTLGSRHRIMRRAIKIEKVSEIDPRTSTEPAFFTTSVMRSPPRAAPSPWLRKKSEFPDNATPAGRSRRELSSSLPNRKAIASRDSICPSDESE